MPMNWVLSAPSGKGIIVQNLYCLMEIRCEIEIHK